MTPLRPLLAAVPVDLLVTWGFRLAFALSFFLIGMGAHKAYTDRHIARMERDMAVRIADLNAELAEEEQRARKLEAGWRADSVRMEATYVAALAKRDRVVRDLVATGNSLRNRLQQITSEASSAAASSPPCRDVHHRVETLGVLLGEADALAEESGREADGIREELALCRAYVEAVTRQD